MGDDALRRTKAQEIYTQFIPDSAATQINIKAKNRTFIDNALACTVGELDANMFEVRCVACAVCAATAAVCLEASLSLPSSSSSLHSSSPLLPPDLHPTLYRRAQGKKFTF